MSWTQVQKKLVNGTAIGSAVSYDSNVTAGNLLLAVAGMNITGQTTLPVVNGFNKARETLGTNCGIGIWYTRANSTGPLSVSASGFAGSYSLAIAEYSFTESGVPGVVGTPTGNVVTSATSIPGLLSAPAGDKLVVGAVRLSGGSSTPRSWTDSFVEQNDTNARGSWAHTLTTATGFGPTYSWVGTLNAALALCAFSVTSTPIANLVKARVSNAMTPKPAYVRIGNAWQLVT